MQITTIGLDLAKRVFQIHGLDAAGEVVIREMLRRSRRVVDGETPDVPKETARIVGMLSEQALGTHA